MAGRGDRPAPARRLGAIIDDDEVPEVGALVHHLETVVAIVHGPILAHELGGIFQKLRHFGPDVWFAKPDRRNVE
ncbi:hypothetical protein ACS72_16840 [Acinetobacter sp. VT 511]|nr:hypothetical protein ACS72_16840 [Acinetobacter sp. VT 511]